MDGGNINHYEFKGFRIDPDRRLLFDPEEKVVALTPKVFDLLLYFVRNQGKLISKDEIMAAVWPDTVVEESNLTQNVSILRRALGDVRGDNAFIVTVPGRGYKFVPDVRGRIADSDAVGNLEPVAIERSKYLRPVMISAGIAAVLAIVIAVIYFSSGREKATAQVKTLAILPFRPLVKENSDEALEMGMTDTLIARLSIPGLKMRPLTSVRRFAEGETDPQAAGRELGADSVLEGNIQRWGEKIRVNVRLIDVESGEPQWSGTFDDEYKDIFVVQDAIADKVASALRGRLAGNAASRATQNVEAYRLYLQGRLYQFRSTPPDVRRAIAFYEQAVELDPAYALAYAAMADAYRMLPITSDVPPTEAFPKSDAAAKKALELDANLSQAYVAAGYVSSWYEWDWKTAETEMRKAIELDANNADAHRGLSILLTALARHDEAIEEMRIARELDPLSLPTNALEAQTLHYAGRDAEAIDRLKKTFEINPDFWIASLMLARIYIRQERFADALEELKRAATASGGNTETISLMGYALAKLGRKDEALKMLKELQSRTDENYSPSYNIAMIYNGLGHRDSALRSLEDAVERRDVRLLLLKIEPKWDGLRAEPRFTAIMKRIGFEKE